MPDQLTTEERALAWESAWNPSFDGIAIVNEDFTFRSVNPQFCKLLGVTPADLIGNRFQDITPPEIRELDEKNAKMIKDGLIDFYILPKTYQFSINHKVDTVLLVNRVPKSILQPFEFFIARIMLDEDGQLEKMTHVENLPLEQSSQKQTSTVVDFLTKHMKTFIAVGSVIAGIAIGIMEWLKQ